METGGIISLDTYIHDMAPTLQKLYYDMYDRLAYARTVETMAGTDEKPRNFVPEIIVDKEICFPVCDGEETKIFHTEFDGEQK